MPTFETPEPISATIEIGVGDVRIAGGDPGQTRVEYRPSDDTDESDVKAAEQVRVDFADGTLRITGPRSRAFDFSRKSRSIQLAVWVPAGSRVAAELQAGDIRGTGELGECRLKTGAGAVSLARTGPLRLESGAGQLAVEAVDGDAEIQTGNGKIHVGDIGGTAVVKSSNGDIAVGAVGGDARLRSANGEIRVDRAGAGLEAKSANGAIRVGAVVRGAVTLETAAGELEIGVAEGTAAWVEVSTGFGRVRNLLDNAAGPDEADQKVEVRGRTSHGDITIRRA